MNRRNNKPHKNEIIPEEGEDENDMLVELKSFKKLNIQKRKTNTNAKEIQNTLKRSNSEEKTTNDDIEEDEEPTNKPRVERFLSICEIPPEILLYQQEMQRKFGATDDNAGCGLFGQKSKKENGTPKLGLIPKRQFPTKKNDFERIDKTKSFSTKFGNGLSQQVRAEIIRNIIKNFNLENYINQFKSDYVIEIELDKK